MHNRETSPSPNTRPRTTKTQSMTLLPSQMYSESAQQGQQPSPTSASGRRSPQLAPGQMQRGLPTPPQPITSLHDENRAGSSSPPKLHTHYPRPVNHIPPQFLAEFRGMGDNYQMTEELLAEIERADLHAQGLIPYPSGTPPKDPSLERVRSMGKSSPKTRQRDNQPRTPERRNSPAYHTPLGSPGEHPAYARRPPANQTPPATVQARSPDKSLPVQEELEDDVAARNGHSWKKGSPAPSSDLHPEDRYDTSGRSSRAGHREEDDDTLIEQTSETRAGGDDTSGSGGTPRSPTSALPPRHNKSASFSRGRTGSTDHLGMAGLDASVLNTDQPPQYFEQGQGRSQEGILHAPRASAGVYPRYYPSQIHPEDLRQLMEHPTSAYIQYFGSPRPEAPIPPTPHSQTNPPSPSPLLSSADHHIAPVGSPYPFPYNHLRRNVNYASPHDHPNVISEQMTRQYQVYAQNNLGHVTDSTLSPSTTPFPRGYFNQWANWHTQKILNGGIGARVSSSITSSPSHEPISLPPPPTIGVKKKRQSLSRKPPPRVESTQPRETSPELCSSSGEETAAGEGFALHEEGNWMSGGRLIARDDDDDWVDEDEDQDEDENDLLELEYHPAFVTNIEKRRRRWETKWDALLQAFQALDRQTDATMVLLAAPSHSSKLHLVTSRSIRRRPGLARLPMLNHIKTGFRQIAADRRAARSLNKLSLADRFLTPSSPGEGSDGGSVRERDLERALSAALGSLGVLGEINEQREARWREEMRRIQEDRERVELLLKQALGEGHTPSTPVVTPPAKT